MIVLSLLLIVSAYLVGRCHKGLLGPHILITWIITFVYMLAYYVNDDLLFHIPDKIECEECEELDTTNFEYIFGKETRLFADDETKKSWEWDREQIEDSIVGRHALRCLQKSYIYVYSPGRGVIISNLYNHGHKVKR